MFDLIDKDETEKEKIVENIYTRWCEDYWVVNGYVLVVVKY